MEKKIDQKPLKPQKPRRRFGLDEGFTRLFALLISVGLWFYVVYAENPEAETWIRGVNISVVNSEDMFLNNLTLLSDKAMTVSVKLRGRQKKIAAATADGLIATIDLKGITGEGEYSLPVNIVPLLDGIELVEKNPPVVAVKIDKIVEVLKTVNVSITGAPAEGYLKGAATATPPGVYLKGPRSVIDTIAALSASLDITGALSDVRRTTEVVPTGIRGERLFLSDVTLSDTSVEISCAILQRKTVPIRPVLPEGDSRFPQGGAVARPSEVSIVGPPDLILKIEAIETEPLGPLLPDTGEPFSAGLIVPDDIKIEGDTASVLIEMPGGHVQNFAPPGDDAE